MKQFRKMLENTNLIQVSFLLENKNNRQHQVELLQFCETV